MSVIIGRIREIKELEEAYCSSESEFVAVYGRRRVGKTYLIRNFFQEKKCIYFQTTGIYKAPLEKQLERFAKELSQVFSPGIPVKIPDNWLDAFEILTQAINQIPKNKKIVLFFDELPWMSTRKSGVIPALEYFWNRYWVNEKRVKLIVCGSAASWIIKKIIKNRAGLHNRVTCKLKLLPFNLNETAAYLKFIGYRCSQFQALKLYMVFGGIPFYLKLLKKGESVDQNIDKLLFDSGGAFFEEFDEVFSSLFEHAEQYKELVMLLAKHKEGVARRTLESMNKLTGSGGRLTKRLEDLEQAGFITSYIPYGHKKYGIFYKISDEYCYFYLKWIWPLRRELRQNTSSKYWHSVINTPEYFSWLGYSFENVCYKHIDEIKNALEIEKASFAYPWRYVPRKNEKNQGAQIDLLFDRKDNAVTICEIKYTDKPFILTKEYANALNRKLEVFRAQTKTKKQLFLAFISANGVKSNSYTDALVAKIISLNDFFG